MIDDLPDEITKTGRHNALKSTAGYLRNFGLDGEDIDDALQRINDDRCKPHLPEREVSSIAAWAGEKDVVKAAETLEILDGVLVLLNDHKPYPDAAGPMFTKTAGKKEIFLYGDIVSAITPDGMKQVSAKAFPSRLDSYGKVMHLIKGKGGSLLLKPIRCSVAVAGGAGML